MIGFARIRSNYSINYYLLVAPDFPDKSDSDEIEQEKLKSHSDWMINLKRNALNDDQSKIKVAYQIEENGYHGRSFEDAFISVNLDNIKKNKNFIGGLQNKGDLDKPSPDFYTLTGRIIKTKSEFASSLLWLALTDKVEWKIPKYIEEGLLWISKK